MTKLYEEELDIMEDENAEYWGPPLQEIEESMAPAEVLYTLVGRDPVVDEHRLNFLSSVARIIRDYVKEARVSESEE